MAVPLEAKEIAVGDYSPEYGTVVKVEDVGQDDISIEFRNGKSIMLRRDSEITIDQGGRFGHRGKSSE